MPDSGVSSADSVGSAAGAVPGCTRVGEDVASGVGSAGVGLPVRAGLAVAVGGLEVAAIGARAHATESATMKQPTNHRRACMRSNPPHEVGLPCSTYIVRVLVGKAIQLERLAV